MIVDYKVKAQRSYVKWGNGELNCILVFHSKFDQF